MTRICFNVSGPSYPDNCFLLHRGNSCSVCPGKIVVTCLFLLFFTSFSLFLFAFLFRVLWLLSLFDRTSFVSRNGDQSDSTTLFCFFFFTFQKWNSYIVILLPWVVPNLQIYLSQCKCIFCIPVSVMLIYIPTCHSEGFFLFLFMLGILQSRDPFSISLSCLCLCTQILTVQSMYFLPYLYPTGKCVEIIVVCKYSDRISTPYF